MKVLLFMFLYTIIICVNTDLLNSPEIQEEKNEFLNIFKKYTSKSTEYENVAHNFRFKGEVYLDAALYDNFLEEINKYGKPQNKFLRENIENLIQHLRYERSISLDLLLSERNIEKKYQFGSEEIYWIFAEKIKSSKGKIVVFVIFKGEATILKEVCETTFANFKSCYTLDKVDENTHSIYKEFLLKEIGKRL